MDLSEGLVVGLIGSWGSGKTSLVNMIIERIDEIGAFTVLNFNPWLFSSTEDLVQNFFLEVGAQLEVKDDNLKKAGELWADYGHFLAAGKSLPFVGGVLDVLAEESKNTPEARFQQSGGMERRRDEITKVMSDLNRPLIVVVDDIDRLESREIRDIFRLVRLTGSFPNIVYVLGFDRQRIEKALDEDNFSGRNYIEKIVQIPIDVPQPSAEGFQSEIVDGIEEALKGVESQGKFDEDRWPVVFRHIIRPMFRNMRDVRRYQAAIAGSVRDLQGETNLVDLLALEAIRVFRPDTFNGILNAAPSFVEPARGLFFARQDEANQAKVRDFVAPTWDDVELRHAVIELLFPQALTYLDDHTAAVAVTPLIEQNRVAYGMFLLRYLERTPGAQLQLYRLAQNLVTTSASRQEIIDYFGSTEAYRRRTLLESLEMVENEISDEQFPTLIATLVESRGDIPDAADTLFRSTNDRLLSGMVGRRVCGAQNPDHAKALLHDTLAAIGNLDFRYDLLRILRNDADYPDCMLTADGWHEVWREYRDVLDVTNVDWLKASTNLGRLLRIASNSSKDMTSVIDRDPTGELARNLLRTSLETLILAPSRDFGPESRKVGDADLLLAIFASCDATLAFLNRFEGETDQELSYARDEGLAALAKRCEAAE
jgi:hypothetical protein